MSAPAVASAAEGVSGLSVSADEPPAGPVRDPRYPVQVLYCPVCSLPAEMHEYLSRSQLERCSSWLRVHAPLLFPDRFPEEAVAALAAREAGEDVGVGVGAAVAGGGKDKDGKDGGVKVAVPVAQKGSVGKKKKLAPEIVVQLAKRKQKTVTVVYGLDLFGIKLTDAAKSAKKKFASGCSVAKSADNRDVIEIQGTRMEDFAQLAHKAFGVPKAAIFLVDTKKKTKICPFDDK